MSVDLATVRRIAHLARIGVSEAEIPHLQNEINAILNFVEELTAVDVEGVEPMTSVMPMSCRCAKTSSPTARSPAKVLANAPLTEDGFFLVPKVDRMSGRVDARLPFPGHALDRSHLPDARRSARPRSQSRAISSVELTQRPSRRHRRGEGAQRLCRRHRREGARRWPRPATRGSPQGEGGPLEGPAARHQGPLRHRGRAHPGLQPHPRRLQAAL